LVTICKQFTDMVQNMKVWLSICMGKTIQLELTIPQRLADIKLEQYQKYVKVIGGIDKEAEDAGDFINLKAMEIFCGLHLKESYKLPMSSFQAVLETIADCLQEPTPLVKRFWFRGSNGTEVEFGMIPDLKNISFGEYIDLDRYIGDWTQMHRAMAILFRPITAKKGEFYEIEDYEGSDKYAGHMLHMPANVALGALVFFYRLGMKLSKHTMDYSLKQMTQEQRQQVESKFSELNGVGINHFMHSLEELSKSLTRLQSSHSLNV
jgi:hypothetical protein